MTESERSLREKAREKPPTPAVRQCIRNARILIVDDHLDDLQGFVQGLKREGFTNIIEKEKIESVHSIVDQEVELVILDLRGVASELYDSDGVGVLSAIKNADPLIQVLVVSGSTFGPEFATALSRADMIRNKPVKPGDLARDVELLLRVLYDPACRAAAMLEEYNGLSVEDRRKVGSTGRVMIWFHRRKIRRALADSKPVNVKRLQKVAEIAESAGLVLKTGKSIASLIAAVS